MKRNSWEWIQWQRVLNQLSRKRRLMLTLWGIFSPNKFRVFVIGVNQGRSVRFSFERSEKMTRKEAKLSYQEYKNI